MVVESGDFTTGQLGARHAHGADRHRPLKAVRRASRRLERVSLASFDIHAPVSLVLQRESAIHVHTQAAPVEWIERLGCIDGHAAVAVGRVQQPPIFRAGRILEGPVANAFGIDAAIGGQVDVLEKNAP